MNGIQDSNPIELNYWENLIKEYLTNETKKIYSCNSRIDRISNYFNTERRFYITGLNQSTLGLISIMDEIREDFPGCYLQFDPDTKISQGKPKFYICATERAQQIVDSKGYLYKFIRAKIGQKETKLFIFFILLFVMSLYLIYNHTKGYKI